MGRRRWLLSFGSLGGAAIALGVTLSNGFLLTVGFVLLTFGAGAVLKWPPTPHSALLTTLPAAGVVFVLGALDSLAPVAVSGVPPSTGHFVLNGAVYTLALAPLLSGYVAVTLHSQGRERTTLRLLFGTLFGGWLAASFLASLQGGHAGFISIVVFGVAGVSFITASLTVVLASGTGSAPRASQHRC